MTAMKKPGLEEEAYIQAHYDILEPHVLTDLIPENSVNEDTLSLVTPFVRFLWETLRHQTIYLSSTSTSSEVQDNLRLALQAALREVMDNVIKHQDNAVRIGMR